MLLKKNLPYYISAVVVFILLATVCSTLVRAIEYGGLGARPANPDPSNPRTESIFVYTLEPTEQKKDAVMVYNNSSSRKEIIVYAVDAQTSNTGAFTCRQLVEPKNQVGSWIQLEKTELRLEPTESEEVPFTVSVPGRVEVGEHNGCIVVQEKAKQTTDSGVALSFRSALRVAITVPGDIVKELSFTDFKIDRLESGAYTFTPHFKNTGNVSVDADIKVKAQNVFRLANYSDGGKFPVLAQQSAQFNFEMSQPFWGGFYRTKATATYNKDPNAVLGQESEEQATISSASKWVVVPPKPLALLIEITLIALVFGSLAYWMRSKRHLRHLRSSWEAYTVKSGDNVKSIAGSHKVSWKKFALINKLKPPYALEKGQKVLVPSVQNHGHVSKKHEK